MLSRYLVSVAGIVLFTGQLVNGQDAQDRTQSFFDNHKSADVINSDRAITDKVRQPTVTTQESTLPPLSGVSSGKPSKANVKQLNKLRNEKKAFVRERVSVKKKAEESATGVKAAMLNEPAMVKTAEKEWDSTDSGRKLRQMERLKQTERSAAGSTLPKLSY
jgi:hypothetical protein